MMMTTMVLVIIQIIIMIIIMMIRCVDNEVEECIEIPTQITIAAARDIEATECATSVNEVSS